MPTPSACSIKIPLALLLVQSLSGCSLEKPEEARLRLEVAPSDPYARSIAREWMFSSGAPASVNDMHCLVLNVMGPGIPNSSINDSSYNFATRFPQAVAGDVCATYGGILSNFTPVTGGTVEVSVPTGSQRLVQVLGMKFVDNRACPAKTYFELERELGGSTPMEALVPNLWQVGRTIVNVTGDTTLDIASTYTQANAGALDIHGCRYRDLNTNQLRFWLKSDALAGYSNGQSVASWTQSASAYNSGSALSTAIVAAPTYLASAINGYPAVRFTTSSSYEPVQLPSSVIGSSTSSYFVAAVLVPQAGSASLTYSVVRFGATTAEAVLQLYYTSANTFRVLANIDGLASAQTSTAQPTGSAYVVWMGSEGGASPTVDGGTSDESFVNTSISPVNFSGTQDRVCVGCRHSSGYVADLNADVAEVVAYSYYLNTSSRKELFCYFNRKYGTAPPPGGC